MKSALVLIFLGLAAALVNSQPTKYQQEEASEVFDKQIEKLHSLKCEPKLQKIYLDRELAKHDISDEFFRPKVLAVKRCDSSCSYCGGINGIERKSCQPSQKKTTVYYVIKYDSSGKVYVPFNVEEHEKCECR